jgi:hypothetical protein
MVPSTHIWLAAQLKCICAPAAHRSSQRVRSILCGPYRRLLASGYRLPPSVAIDLALLFENGPSVRFEIPPGLDVSGRTLLGAYCSWLNADRGALALHRTAARLDWLKNIGLTEGFGAERDVGTLLQIAAEALPSLDGMPAEPLARDLEALDAGSVESWLSGNGSPAAVQPALAEFFRRLSLDAIAEVLDDARSFLVEAAATVNLGAEAIDLPLLATCMSYQPLNDPDPASTRKLLDRIQPEEQRPARRPDIGNNGLTTRGNLSALLPSFLARPDFAERYLRKELLYFDRHAPQLEPRRVLVAWIIDRSAAMRLRVRAGWPRRDSLALRLAALALEDALRRLGPLATVELQTAVIVHNGGTRSTLEGRLILPDERDVAHVKRGLADRDVHILRVPAGFPHYVLREPEWPKEPLFDLTRASGSAVERALELLHAVLLAAADPERERAPHRALFDAVQITVALPGDAPDRDLDRRTPPALHALADSCGLNTLIFEDDVAVRWHGSITGRKQVATVPHSESATLALDEIRAASWGDLLQRLAN